MLIYHGKRFTFTRAGSSLVDVECDRCGCQYCYELARVGSGSSTSHYWIGQSSAKTASAEHADQDLRNRLVREAELVPCPKCRWISEDLVRGYRLGRMRHFGNWAIAIAIVGTSVSLMAAWFMSTGPAIDREMSHYVLCGGPAVSISLAALLILLRQWLRSRIQPNRDYPLEPKLPVGTPPALFYDERSDTLHAARDGRQSLENSPWISFQVGRQQLPQNCCDCSKPASSGVIHSYPVAEAVFLQILRCPECARRAKWCSRSAYLISFVIMNVLASLVLLVLRLEPDAFWLILGGCFLVSLALAAWVASSFTKPVSVRVADRSRLILRLRFRNPEYHRYVAEQLIGDESRQGKEKETRA
jgi:hypothetical protein